MNIVAGITRLFMWVLGRQPLSLHYMWARVIKWILRDVLHYRRDVIFINLSRCFPDKKYSDIQRIADEYYEHVAQIAAETIWHSGCTNAKRVLKAGICSVANPGVLNDLWKQGRSIVLMNSHSGNWELYGCFHDFAEYDFTRNETAVVYKALHNKVWNEVFRKIRISPHPDFKGEVESAGLLRYMVSNKNRQMLYIINNDQYPYQSALEIGEFLHLPTTAHGGTASIAHKLGFAVVFLSMNHDRKGHYTMSFTKICDNASEMEPVAIMRKFYDCLEADINSNPHNWLWSHKRWKNIK